jgi:hypothetical protein
MVALKPAVKMCIELYEKLKKTKSTEYRIKFRGHNRTQQPVNLSMEIKRGNVKN